MTGSDHRAGLADVLDDHRAVEFTTRDVDATMAPMTDDPYLTHVPVLTGGIGREDVCRFYLDPAGLPVVGAEQAGKLLAPRAIPAKALPGPDWADPP